MDHNITNKFFFCFFLLFCALISCDRDEKDPNLLKFPAGYIDSPYIVEDGSALYFLHSVAATYDIITANPDAQPIAEYLPNHHGQGGNFWWNTDLYISFRNADDTWGQPQNLGDSINTIHMECCAWVNPEQTLIIFTRESVTGDSEHSGSFISTRSSNQAEWKSPIKLPDVLGDYSNSGFHDFHLTEAGNLYFWRSHDEAGGELYYARSNGANGWEQPQQLPQILHTSNDETQPWINNEETVLYFNRRFSDGTSHLMVSKRDSPLGEWGEPTRVEVDGVADPMGYKVWGEPSFDQSDRMYFVRFNTSKKSWDAELMRAMRIDSETFGGVEQIRFK